MQGEMPIWRSMLFIPADAERFFGRAHERGADAIQLDLEDGVLPENRERARELVGPAADAIAAHGQDVIVRINRPWRDAVRDMEAAVRPSVKALTLPKADSAEHVRAAAETVGEIEAERGMAPGATRLIAMIETPDSAFRIREIAAASPRLCGLIVGIEDFTALSGMRADSEGLLQVHVDTVLAARAAGIAPYGFVASLADFSDLDALAGIVAQARRLGFVGAFCIHPTQVAVLNEGFSPSEREVAEAEAVVEAFDAAREAGRGAVALNGRMIDRPVVERARAVLAQRDRLSP